jgi:O-acetylserine/cysteine efflux transporter
MNRSRRLVFAALISAGVLWGTTVPLSKIALIWLPPAWLAFTRFGLAAVILMLVSRSRLRGAASPAILISGALGYGGSVVLQNFGIERTSVTHAALLIGATPVMVAILAAVCRHGVARPAAWAGFVLSLVGVAVIAAGKGGGATMAGDGLVLLSQLASASFTVSQARLLRGRDPVAVTALQLLAAAAVTLPLALLSGLHAGPAAPASVLATSALVVVGTVAPTALFAFAQSRVAADIAGAFLNLEPLVGAIAGTVLFANPVGPVQVAGGAAILAGIGLSSAQAVRSARSRPVPAAAPAPERAPALAALATAPADVGLAAARADAGLADAWTEVARVSAWADVPLAGAWTAVGPAGARVAAGRDGPGRGETARQEAGRPAVPAGARGSRDFTVARGAAAHGLAAMHGLAGPRGFEVPLTTVARGRAAHGRGPGGRPRPGSGARPAAGRHPTRRHPARSPAGQRSG